jgi:hypothetical protein
MGANAGNTLIQWEGYEAITRFAQGAGYPGGSDTHLRGHLLNVRGFSFTGKRAWARFSGVMPRHYTLGPVIFYWWFTMNYATTGTTVWWATQGRRTGAGLSIQGHSYAIPVTHSVSGGPIQASIYLAQALWPGEYFQIDFLHDPENGNNTSPGMPEMLGAELREV